MASASWTLSRTESSRSGATVAVVGRDDVDEVCAGGVEQPATASATPTVSTVGKRDRTLALYQTAKRFSAQGCHRPVRRS